MARRQRKRKLHGWDTLSASGNVNIGTPPRPYVAEQSLQIHQAETTALVRGPDPFYCERIILDVYPYIGRVDVQSPPYRTWQWMLVVCEIDAMFEMLESDLATIGAADMYDNTNELFDQCARILQQGNMPVYDSMWGPQGGEGGPIITGNTGSFLSMVDSPAGPERLHVDLTTKFSLHEGQALFYLMGPANTAEWEDGDQLAWDLFYKALWTQRST